MKRRDFIAMLGGSAAAWPLGARAQTSAYPVIGYLGSQSPDRELLERFHQGLREFGFVEGQNLKIEYRWGYNHYNQLPALAADLVKRQVALIVTGGGSVAAKAAKAATSTIPILFISGLDPIREQLVASFSHPGSNATGLRHYNVELLSKRLELLNQLLPPERTIEASSVACLINDDDRGLESDKAQIQDVIMMARKLGLVPKYARAERDIEDVFASMAHQNIKALLVDSDPLFIRQRALIATLATRNALPAGYRNREFVEAGGLMSYGPNLPESWRQIGEYAGRILNGAKPEDLPVMLPRKYELVVNRRAVKALGLSFKRILVDEIIE